GRGGCPAPGVPARGGTTSEVRFLAGAALVGLAAHHRRAADVRVGAGRVVAVGEHL
ncbi:MAG: hypothetical protein AVDCRST_MAG68-288, partial [uncultured Gemmatimonadetes bacterium]